MLRTHTAVRLTDIQTLKGGHQRFRVHRLTLELAGVVSEGTMDQELPALEGTVVLDELEPDAHSHESNESSSDGGPLQIPATGTGSGQAGPAKGNKKIRLVDAVQGLCWGLRR